MGEEGNEQIKFKLAGKNLDKIKGKLGGLSGKLTKSIFKTERFALTTQEVILDSDWKKYEVDLTGVDLKGITHPFGFELSANGGQKQIVYIKGVVYDDKPAENPLAATGEDFIEPLAAEIISNTTNGVAPATFEFGANVTGGTEPYSIEWDFNDGNQGEGQNIVHTFASAGEYNVTLTVADTEGQNASDSIEIQVAEPKIVEEEIDNSTATNATQTVFLKGTTTTK
jgi:PKD repeat protein